MDDFRSKNIHPIPDARPLGDRSGEIDHWVDRAYQAIRDFVGGGISSEPIKETFVEKVASIRELDFGEEVVIDSDSSSTSETENWWLMQIISRAMTVQAENSRHTRPELVSSTDGKLRFLLDISSPNTSKPMLAVLDCFSDEIPENLDNVFPIERMTIYRISEAEALDLAS